MKEFHLIINTSDVDLVKLERFCNEVKRLNLAEEKNGIFYCENAKAKEFNDLFYKITLSNN